MMVDGSLNKEQAEAASWSGSHLLVLAGAGTGKTKTIIARAQFLIENSSSPERLHILTFTRRAAAEIVERVKLKLGDRSKGLRASTFHSWCMQTVRKQPKLFGCSEHTVIDREDQLYIFKILRSASSSAKDARLPKAAALCDLYSFVRNSNSSLREYIEAEQPKLLELFSSVVDIMKCYEARKSQKNYLDYDDILDIVATQLAENFQVRDIIGDMYDEILVDEMQDTNPLQWKLINPLLEHIRFFCVGDDAQSIYGFRGADFKNIHSFTERVAGASVMRLSLNYRSTQEILDISNWLLSESVYPYDKNLIAARGLGLKPVLRTFSSEWSESRWIAEDLLKHHANGDPWKENLILTRTAYSGRTIEMSLVEKKIPYKFVGGTKLFESAHIKDLLSAVRIIANPLDEIAWIRYLTLWEGVGDVTAGQAIEAIALTESLKDAISILRKHQRLAPDSINILEDAFIQVNVSAMITTCFKGMQGTLENKYKAQNWEKRSQDINVILQLSSKKVSLSDFLNEYVIDPLYVTEPTLSDEDDKVTLSTIHSAKGTESNRVYIINVTPGAYPSTRSYGSEESIEEERRVLYVALTRAKNELIMTRSGYFSEASASATMPTEYSRYFLTTLPENMCQVVDERYEGAATESQTLHTLEKPGIGIRFE